MPLPGTRYQFDLAVAVVGSWDEAERVDRAIEEARDEAETGARRPLTAPPVRHPARGRPVLDMTTSGMTRFDPIDYVTPTDEQIDASIRAFGMTAEGSVQWGDEFIRPAAEMGPVLRGS